MQDHSISFGHGHTWVCVLSSLRSHRTTESCSGLEGTYKHVVCLLCHGKEHCHKIRLLKILFIHWSNFNVETSTTSLGNLFHPITFFTVNSFFLMTNLYVPLFNLKLLPLALLLWVFITSLSLECISKCCSKVSPGPSPS